MFHFLRHPWSDWSVTERGDVFRNNYNAVLPHTHERMGTYLIQERFCRECGKTQIKRQKTTVRGDVVLIPKVTHSKPKHDKVGAQ